MLDGSVFSNSDVGDLKPNKIAIGASLPPPSALASHNLPSLDSVTAAAILKQCKFPPGRFIMASLTPEDTPSVELFEQELLRSWNGSTNSELSFPVSSNHPRFMAMYFDNSISTEYYIPALFDPHKEAIHGDYNLSIWDRLSSPSVLSEGTVCSCSPNYQFISIRIGLPSYGASTVGRHILSTYIYRCCVYFEPPFRLAIPQLIVSRFTSYCFQSLCQLHIATLLP